MAEIRAPLPASVVVASAIVPREGADLQVTTLGPHAIATAADSVGTFNGWTCTAVPAAGDPAFPTGTTTGAVSFGDPAAASTTVTLPGPGYYELSADIGGKTETLGIYATRPLPVAATTISTGAGTAGAGVAPTVSETAGADTPTYLTTATKVSDVSEVTVSTDTSTTPTWTNPAQDADGDSVAVVHTVTDAYGRTSTVSPVLDLAGNGGGILGATWSLVEEVDLTDGNVTSGSTASTGAFTIYESDGTTPRLTGTVLSPGTATGTVYWSSSGVRVECTGGTGARYAIFDAPVSSLADEEKDWHVDVIMKPAALTASDIILMSLGNNSNPGAGTSVGIDVQNTAGTYDIEIRRTSGGATYGAQELPGALPTTMSGRLESRGSTSCWVWWNSSGSAYLADSLSDKTGGDKAHSASGGIASTSLWNGAAYIGIGCTSGGDVTMEKWRTRELT
jgi:hypothetical protein